MILGLRASMQRGKKKVEVEDDLKENYINGR